MSEVQATSSSTQQTCCTAPRTTSAVRHLNYYTITLIMISDLKPFTFLKLKYTQKHPASCNPLILSTGRDITARYLLTESLWVQKQCWLYSLVDFVVSEIENRCGVNVWNVLLQ